MAFNADARLVEFDRLFRTDGGAPDPFGVIEAHIDHKMVEKVRSLQAAGSSS